MSKKNLSEIDICDKYITPFVLSAGWDLRAQIGREVSFNVNQVRKFVLPIPPLEEQKEIVRQVDYLMSLCDQLETHITTRNTSAEQLMKAVVGEILEAENKKEEELPLRMVVEEKGKYE